MSQTKHVVHAGKLRFKKRLAGARQFVIAAAALFGDAVFGLRDQLKIKQPLDGGIEGARSMRNLEPESFETSCMIA